jgi:5-methylcytosine-specific restriction endonuclease McrA
VTKDRSEYFKNYYETHKKQCAAATARWWKAHPDKLKAKDRRRYYRHKDRKLEYAAQYRAKNIEVIKQRKRDYQIKRQEHLQHYLSDYYEQNKEQIKKRAREYYQRNKARYFAAGIKRRALQIKASGNLKALRYFVKQVQSKAFAFCYYCQTKVRTTEIHFDHMIPLSKGGEHSVDNICVSCATCNLKKHSRSVSEWRRKGQQLLPI